MKTDDKHQPEHSTSLETRLNEVEELIGLAEEISTRIEALEESFASSRGQSMVVLVATYLVASGIIWFLLQIEMANPLIAQPLGIIGLCIVSLFGIGYTSSRLRIRNRAKRDMEIEVRLIGELLEMITGLMASVDSEVSVVKRAILTMRLRRIQFTADRVL